MADTYGRPAMLVPRYLDKEMLLTLTWVGKEFQLNLMAETFIDSPDGLTKGENCVLSFGQPKCLGMEHVSSREKTIFAETIKINSNLFYNADKVLIKDKKVLVYVMDTVSDHGKEISSSNAMIGINMPGIGQISQVSVPFKTRAEMTNTALKDIKPVNWAAFCLSVKFDAV